MWPFGRKQRSSPVPVVVLGSELAAARRAEEARIAKGGSKPSPLGPECRYDYYAGDCDLSNPRPSDVDSGITQLCRRYASSDSAARAEIRDSLSMEDFYALITFARRSAVFAMRKRESGCVRDGLCAIAMIEHGRIDPRDAGLALAPLYEAARRTCDSPDAPFREAAALAEPDMSRSLSDFVNQPRRAHYLRALRFAVVDTPAGPGFVKLGPIGPYKPTLPLDQIALGLAALVSADKYQAEASLALPVPPVNLKSEHRAALTASMAGVPPVWLKGVDDAALTVALGKVTASATVNGRLRPGESADHRHQLFVLFVAELADRSSAQVLMRIAQEKSTRRNDFAMLAVQRGYLFVLAIARSVMQGKPAFETQDSIHRFEQGITEVLASGSQ